MSQSYVVKAGFPDLNFHSNVNEGSGVWNEADAAGKGIGTGGRVPLYPDNMGPAVIRLTHNSNMPPTSTYSSHSVCEARSSSPVSLTQLNSVSVLEVGHDSADHQHERTWSQAQSMFPSIHENNKSGSHIQLLQSKDNCRPASRNKTSHHTDQDTVFENAPENQITDAICEKLDSVHQEEISVKSLSPRPSSEKVQTTSVFHTDQGAIKTERVKSSKSSHKKGIDMNLLHLFLRFV